MTFLHVTLRAAVPPAVCVRRGMRGSVGCSPVSGPHVAVSLAVSVEGELCPTAPQEGAQVPIPTVRLTSPEPAWACRPTVNVTLAMHSEAADRTEALRTRRTHQAQPNAGRDPPLQGHELLARLQSGACAVVRAVAIARSSVADLN
jgi:hypothetical protein